MYKSVDVFRFIAAIMVVAIHTQLLREFEIGYYSRSICRIAVPFFFTASSFLFFKKKTSITHYLKRIARLYLVWFCLYSPYVVRTFFINNCSFEHNLLHFIHNLFFHNSFPASWFLMSSMISMTLVYYLSRKINNRVLLMISVLLYVCSLLSSSYYGIINNEPFITVYKNIDKLFVPSNSFFAALIYVVLGKCIADGMIPTKRSSILMLMLILPIWLLEIHQVKSIARYNDAFVCLPFISFYLTSLLISVESKVSKELSMVFRKMSVLIYLMHYIYINLVYMVLNVKVGSIMFVIVMLLVIPSALIVIKMSKRYKTMEYLL